MHYFILFIYFVLIKLLREFVLRNISEKRKGSFVKDDRNNVKNNLNLEHTKHYYCKNLLGILIL